MLAEEIMAIVRPFSPWQTPRARRPWLSSLPSFHRPVFHRLVEGLEQLPQILSVTGPRRVGKTTLLHQLVKRLIDEQKVHPRRVFYYSFDDPALYQGTTTGANVLEGLVEALSQRPSSGGPSYLFLDEIQRLERWELYLKKFYDLKAPVRWVVSGSASSPVFKKSRESLLGRIKDYHVLPFSFREFALFKLENDDALRTEVEAIHTQGQELVGRMMRGRLRAGSEPPAASPKLWEKCQILWRTYLLEGGYPEVWSMPTFEQKVAYLFDNQVKKVIYEDLVLATELRKPEELKQFFISLLACPGTEVNISKLSNDLGVDKQQIEKYLPLLELTDLIAHAGKFRHSPLRLRHGSRKFYLVDLALRNAVLRIGEELLDDPPLLGLYAENLVFNALRKNDEVLRIDYYRDGDYEVDFIVHHRAGLLVPVEVKYRAQASRGAADVSGLRRFFEKQRSATPILVTRDLNDAGWDAECGVYRLPLLQFLIIFD